MAVTPEPQACIDVTSTENGPAVTKIANALASPTRLEFVETPLKDVVDYLKDLHRIEIQLDSPSLREAGVDESTPVTKNLQGISLRSALKLLLDELQLKYIIHNEVLLITSLTKADSDEYMPTRIYPVKDLILVRNENGDIETNFQPLIDLIATTVTPKGCVCIYDGGSASISPYQFQDRCLLVIRQTQELHEEIVALLAALRRCAPADDKTGTELRLPQRPETVNPTKFSSR